jgi:pentapeptide MXKDX repeat protein
MTTQAEDLLGARVTGTDGKVVGTVEQVFRDDVDGTPAWARVRSGKTGRFVPLGSCQVTAEGLIVPFDTQKIMGGPNIDAGQHMSAAQAEELSRYYGLTVPAQQPRGPMAEDKMAEDKMAQDKMAQATGQDSMAQDTVPQDTMPQSQMPQGHMTQEDWLVRQEERIQVGKETLETGRIKLHKYVDVEPVDQAIHVFHEEYDVERIPITADERISGNIQEGEQEIILHEERAVLRKEVVPVERVRLRARRVEEDSTVHDELRRERIEIEPDQAFASSHGGNSGSGRN